MMEDGVVVVLLMRMMLLLSFRCVLVDSRTIVVFLQNAQDGLERCDSVVPIQYTMWHGGGGYRVWGGLKRASVLDTTTVTLCTGIACWVHMENSVDDEERWPGGWHCYVLQRVCSISIVWGIL